MGWCPSCDSEDVELIETFYPIDFGIQSDEECHVHILRCNKCDAIIYCLHEDHEFHGKVVSSIEEAINYAKNYFKK